MNRVTFALAVFVVLHSVAFALVLLASRRVKPGGRSPNWRYLLRGGSHSDSELTPEGLRLAALARAVSWVSFLISAAILVFMN